MRLQKTDIVAGLEAPSARKFVRAMNATEFDQQLALRTLQELGASNPQAALAQLDAEKYIERTGADHGGRIWWMTTIKGNALAMASFGKPITRTTADRLLEQLLERTRALNADPTRLLSIARLRVFGSYLDATIDPLGDLDVELVLADRVSRRELIAYGKKADRQFSSLIDQMFWAQREFVRDLRNRATAVNIIQDDVSSFTDAVRVVYRIEDDPGALVTLPKL